MSFKTRRISFFTLILISCSLLYFNFSFFPKNILSWDVFGYYLYLPLNFIYNNWGLQDTAVLHNVLDHYHNSATLYQAYPLPTGSWVLRYPIGMSYLYAPFFFIGHLLARFTDFPKDGFSQPYQVAILSGGIFYSILGFYFLRKVLLRYYSDAVSAGCMFIIYFGTNYFMHSSFQGTNAMSHNYLFTLYAAITWFTIRWHETFGTKHLLLLATACGLTIMARPSELVCLFIPFFWQVGTTYSLKEKIALFFKRKTHTFIFFFVLFTALLPQLIYWKVITGKFLFNSYDDNPGEGFEFLHPFITQVLFSFRKGWLVYTPVMLLAIAGLVVSIRQKKEYINGLLIYFIINFYIVASWSCWWYAESFGQRSLIPSYALMVLPLGAFLTMTLRPGRKWLAITTVTVAALFVSLNLFQTWQYLNNVIHPSRMTKEAYFSVFGMLDTPEDYEKILVMDRSGGPVEIDPSLYTNTKDWTQEFDTIPDPSADFVFSGANSMKMDSAVIYSPPIKKAYMELTEKDHAKLKVSMQVYSTGDIKNNPGSLVITFEHKQKSYGYSSTDIEDFKIEPNKWSEVSVNYLTPLIRTPEDTLKVYYWHRGRLPLYIDKLKVEVWEPKN